MCPPYPTSSIPPSAVAASAVVAPHDPRRHYNTTAFIRRHRCLLPPPSTLPDAAVDALSYPTSFPRRRRRCRRRRCPPSTAAIVITPLPPSAAAFRCHRCRLPPPSTPPDADVGPLPFSRHCHRCSWVAATMSTKNDITDMLSARRRKSRQLSFPNWFGAR